MKNLLIIFLLTVSISANEQIPAPPQKNPILLKNGLIHTVSNGIVEGLSLIHI